MNQRVVLLDFEPLLAGNYLSFGHPIKGAGRMYAAAFLRNRSVPLRRP
jgi:hypothetical protein